LGKTQVGFQMIYANEHDPKAAHWLACLPLGIDHVDSRSIHDVTGADLDEYTESHFFAGIGGWPLALRMAGWPADELVWTGSCPCQPFSAAGKGKGFDDERHLWPEFLRLIAECKPATVFGEQVASKAGREWLAVVRLDLEALGYAVGAADLCAAGIGAPHIRQRLFWVADAGHGKERIARKFSEPTSKDETATPRQGNGDAASRHRNGSGVADAEGQRGRGRPSDSTRSPGRSSVEIGCTWADVDYIPCRDRKARPVKPGVRLLDHGIPGRVAQLRGLGNAIVPQIAAEFIAAFMETRQQ
jgi:DNA (cytosine-5)-methyltransferase 1